MELKIYRSREDELIKGCRKGDARAQRQLYDLYSSKMYAVCYRYVRHPMEAEDVLIMGFTKIFERIHQFREEGSFEGWIRRIMVNEALTWLRKSRAMYPEIDLEQAHLEVDYEKAADRLEAEDLLRMIAELPAGYRVVFNMYAIDGYSHKEIAEKLGINENTSKSQLSRARAYLQKMLMEKEWAEEKKNQQS